VERRLLDTTDLFALLPPEVLDELSAHATVRTLSRNEVLFHEGDPSDALYVIQEGRIAIATQSGDGRETVFAVLEHGELFGELPLFDDAPRSADARALTQASVIELGYAPVRALLREQRLRATNEALSDAVFLDVPARTAKRLLELAGAELHFNLPVTQEELAAMVGASRERVNKAISLFVKLGWLEIEGRSSYRILDRESLEDRATL
jgi:CRP-like cAMP-binding protein